LKLQEEVRVNFLETSNTAFAVKLIKQKEIFLLLLLLLLILIGDVACFNLSALFFGIHEIIIW